MVKTSWKKIILTVAIAIIFVLFVGFGIEAFYSSPEYDDFCDERPVKMTNTMTSCEEVGGTWVPYDRGVDLEPQQYICTRQGETENGQLTLNCETNEMLTERNGYCDYRDPCYEEWDNAREKYNRNVFFIAGIVGLIAIFAGGAILSLESVGSGVLGGGVLTVIYGTIRYWSGLGEYMRFALLGVILAFLVWIGYKKIKD